MCRGREQDLRSRRARQQDGGGIRRGGRLVGPASRHFRGAGRVRRHGHCRRRQIPVRERRRHGVVRGLARMARGGHGAHRGRRRSPPLPCACPSSPLTFPTQRSCHRLKAAPRESLDSGILSCLGRNDEFCSSDLEVWPASIVSANPDN